MEILKILAGPVIGAVIGYTTNYIAVKMLFKPLYPVKIGNFTLPLRPVLYRNGKRNGASSRNNGKQFADYKGRSGKSPVVRWDEAVGNGWNCRVCNK
jgi:hypothetical protein